MRSRLAAAVTRTPARLWGILLGPRLRGKWKRWRWEQRWRRPSSQSRWLGRGVPPEVVVAVEAGWFPRGARALDIGCGDGDVAGWLAAQGFPTVGVDFVPSALEQARTRFPESPGRLEFHAVDVCQGPPPDRSYGVLVDHRCYHQIAPEDRRGYWRSIARVAAPDARLLLISRAFRGLRPPGDPVGIRRVTATIEDGMDGAFVIERVAQTWLDPFHGRDPDRARPGLAFWMTRRGDGQPR
jgi:SAM-dependent methyltransferase